MTFFGKLGLLLSSFGRALLALFPKACALHARHCRLPSDLLNLTLVRLLQKNIPPTPFGLLGRFVRSLLVPSVSIVFVPFFLSFSGGAGSIWVGQRGARLPARPEQPSGR